MVCHSLLQWTTYSQTSPPWPTRLGWPHRAWFSFVELDKAVVLVWLDWLVFCEYGFMCLPSDALSQHLPSYLGFSYLGRGVSPHRRPSWPWTWSSSSRPSCSRTATAPWTWGSSSRPPALTLDWGGCSCAVYFPYLTTNVWTWTILSVFLLFRAWRLTYQGYHLLVRELIGYLEK